MLLPRWGALPTAKMFGARCGTVISVLLVKWTWKYSRQPTKCRTGGQTRPDQGRVESRGAADLLYTKLRRRWRDRETESWRLRPRLRLRLRQANGRMNQTGRQTNRHKGAGELRTESCELRTESCELRDRPWCWNWAGTEDGRRTDGRTSGHADGRTSIAFNVFRKSFRFRVFSQLVWRKLPALPLPLPLAGMGGNAAKHCTLLSFHPCPPPSLSLSLHFPRLKVTTQENARQQDKQNWRKKISVWCPGSSTALRGLAQQPTHPTPLSPCLFGNHHEVFSHFQNNKCIFKRLLLEQLPARSENGNKRKWIRFRISYWIKRVSLCKTHSKGFRVKRDQCARGATSFELLPLPLSLIALMYK